MQIVKSMLLVNLAPCALVQSTFLKLRFECLAIPMCLFNTMFILFWANLLHYSFSNSGWFMERRLTQQLLLGFMISLQMHCEVLDSIRKQHRKLRELMVMRSSLLKRFLRKQRKNSNCIWSVILFIPDGNWLFRIIAFI